MPSFSESSLAKLETADSDLQALFKLVVKKFDCTILVGHRDKIAQDLAYEKGNSKLKWPDSKHNTKPSLAVDAAPYPINWGDHNTPKEQRVKALCRFYLFAGYVIRTAETMGIKIRWGGDWDMDLDIFDQTFDDLVHFEKVVE